MNLTQVSNSDLIEIKKTLKNYEKKKTTKLYPDNIEEALKYNYKFWNTQPVTGLSEIESRLCVIKENEELEEITKFNTLVSDLFEWYELDLSKEENIVDLYKLLRRGYTRTYDGRFSYEYSKNFLNWYFNVFGEGKNINVCLRVKENKKLVGFIGGVFLNVQVFDKKVDSIIPSFLCLHDKLREKRVTPKLLSLFIQKSIKMGVNVGCYSNKSIFSKPFCSLNTFHRPLNYQRLYDFKYCYHDSDTDIENILDSYYLPEELTSNKFIKLEKERLDSAYELFNEYIDKYNVHPNFTKHQFSTWVLNDNTESFVVVDDNNDDNNNVLDFISYNVLGLNVLNSPTGEKLKVAKLTYYTTENKSILFMLKNALISAKNLGIDLFSIIDCMENNILLRLFNFYEGKDKENYYFYNFGCRSMESKQVGLIFI